MSRKKGIKTYALEVKLEVVRLFFEEEKTRAEITKTLGLRSKEQLAASAWAAA
jgi:transposase-like protein